MQSAYISTLITKVSSLKTLLLQQPLKRQIIGTSKEKHETNRMNISTETTFTILLHNSTACHWNRNSICMCSFPQNPVQVYRSEKHALLYKI